MTGSYLEFRISSALVRELLAETRPSGGNPTLKLAPEARVH